MWHNKQECRFVIKKNNKNEPPLDCDYLVSYILILFILSPNS